MSLTPEALERFVRDLAAEPGRWERFVRHSADDRIYARIWDDEEVNAWLICWSEDQDTGFHDHDDSAAAIIVIEGEIREERLRLAAEPSVTLARPGVTVGIPASAIHRVLHSGTTPAVTIHAYSPPLRRTGTYRLGTTGVLERVSQAGEHELRAEPALR